MQILKTNGSRYLMAINQDELLSYTQKLKRKSEVTRGAHSFVADKYGTRAFIIKIILLVGSTISTTIIFTNFSNQLYVIIAGFFSLCLFIGSLIELVLNYEKNAESHSLAIRLLSTLIRDLDKAEETKSITEEMLREFQNRYNWINESSPLIPDKHFLEAKKRYRLKKEVSKALDDNANLNKNIKQLEKEICVKIPNDK